MNNFEKHMLDIISTNGNISCYWREEYLKEKTREYCGEHACDECYKAFFEWLKEGYKEPIQITEDEKVILKNLPKEYKWIVRDSSNYICIHNEEPMKMVAFWDSDSKTEAITVFSHLFQFIKWEDEEPHSIEELLKGE